MGVGYSTSNFQVVASWIDKRDRENEVTRTQGTSTLVFYAHLPRALSLFAFGGQILDGVKP
jgi:hypothetical protein